MHSMARSSNSHLKHNRENVQSPFKKKNTTTWIHSHTAQVHTEQWGVRESQYDCVCGCNRWSSQSAAAQWLIETNANGWQPREALGRPPSLTGGRCVADCSHTGRTEIGQRHLLQLSLIVWGISLPVTIACPGTRELLWSRGTTGQPSPR